MPLITLKCSPEVRQDLHQVRRFRVTPTPDDEPSQIDWVTVEHLHCLLILPQQARVVAVTLQLFNCLVGTLILFLQLPVGGTSEGTAASTATVAVDP